MTAVLKEVGHLATVYCTFASRQSLSSVIYGNRRGTGEQFAPIPMSTAPQESNSRRRNAVLHGLISYVSKNTLVLQGVTLLRDEDEGVRTAPPVHELDLCYHAPFVTVSQKQVQNVVCDEIVPLQTAPTLQSGTESCPSVAAAPPFIEQAVRTFIRKSILEDELRTREPMEEPQAPNGAHLLPSTPSSTERWPRE